MEGELIEDKKNDKAAETVSIKHYNRLITELRCPGCAYPMRAPILQCATGHSICERCTKILEFCPLCKKGFTNLRSLTVEALCAKAHFPCINASSGCKVRLPTKLLDWHEEHCAYKKVKCFMGKVWDDCNFTCREIDWKEHIEDRHKDKIYSETPVNLTWDLKKRLVPLAAYYVLQAFGEMFYLYQIYDRTAARVFWTVTCISSSQEQISKFAFEVEIYCPADTSQIICQRFPCHSENDKDILQEGTCVSVDMADILRFVNEDKVLFYKIDLREIDASPSKSAQKQEAKILQKDFQLTSIEGVNHKMVPSEIIVTKASTTKELNDSDSDEALEEYVLQVPNSTPKLNFNKKFIRITSSNSDMGGNALLLKEDNQSVAKSRSLLHLDSNKNLNPFERITKSFRNLKADLPDFKILGKNKKAREH